MCCWQDHPLGSTRIYFNLIQEIYQILFEESSKGLEKVELEIAIIGSENLVSEGIIKRSD